MIKSLFTNPVKIGKYSIHSSDGACRFFFAPGYAFSWLKNPNQFQYFADTLMGSDCEKWKSLLVRDDNEFYSAPYLTEWSASGPLYGAEEMWTRRISLFSGIFD